MIFRFIKYYTSESFKIDIPVSFVIPKSFKSFAEMGVLEYNKKEVCELLSSIGVAQRHIHAFRITKDEVIVSLKKDDYESIKKILLRDKILKELGI